MALCKAEIAAERIYGWAENSNGSSYPYLTYPEQQEYQYVAYKNLETAVLSVLAFILLVKFKLKNEVSNSNIWKSSKPGNTCRVAKARLLLPFRLPIIDGIYNLIKFRIDGVRALEEVAKKFGNLYEIAVGPIDCIVVADPVIAQKVLCSTQPEHLNKPRQVYDRIFVDFFHDGLVSSEYKIWNPHRKMLSRSFTYKSLQHYLKFMNTHAKNLAKNLISAASKDENSCVEQERIHHLIYCNAIKITSQIVMGKDKFTEEESAEFTHNFNSYKHLVLYRFMNPHLMIEPVWWFHPRKKEYDRLNRYLNTFIANITQQYRTEYESSKKNVKHAVITGNAEIEKLKTDQNDNCVGEKPFRCMIEEMLCCDATDKEIYDEVGTIMGTGHETTVVAIQMLLLHLALNPEHQICCREEMDNVINEKLSTNNDEFDCELSMDDLSNLKYLERCILESGRITPTVPTFIRRLDAPLVIDEDLVFPAGTNVAPIPWMLHRDPDQFPDPLKFDPDRFLTENCKTRHPYAYIPFSAGARNCIGYKVALMEIKVIMAWILRHFEISSKDKLEDVKLLFEVTLLPERNYNITLKRRKF